MRTHHNCIVHWDRNERPLRRLHAIVLPFNSSINIQARKCVTCTRVPAPLAIKPSSMKNSAKPPQSQTQSRQHKQHHKLLLKRQVYGKIEQALFAKHVR
jgi:hypothetical protein